MKSANTWIGIAAVLGICLVAGALNIPLQPRGQSAAREKRREEEQARLQEISNLQRDLVLKEMNAKRTEELQANLQRISDLQRERVEREAQVLKQQEEHRARLQRISDLQRAGKEREPLRLMPPPSIAPPALPSEK